MDLARATEWISDGKALWPADALARHFLAKHLIGAKLCQTTYAPRSLKQHKFFRGFLSFVSERLDQPEWQDADHLLDALKFAVGYVETFVTFDGEVVYKPKSTSFSEMPHDEFNLFFDRCVDVLLTKLLADDRHASLRDEIAWFIAHPRRKAA